MVSVKGMIGERQRMRIAYTTRRGPGRQGQTRRRDRRQDAGYARVKTAEDESDDRLGIVDNEAALVRRIFKLYADGTSLKKICRILNAEGIPSHRAHERGKYNAGIWNASTLSGSVELGEGILNNSLYVGTRILNRRI